MQKAPKVALVPLGYPATNGSVISPESLGRIYSKMTAEDERLIGSGVKPEFISHTSSTRDREWFGIEFEGILVGGIAVNYFRYPRSKKLVGLLSDAFVLPEYRRRKIQTNAIKLIEEMARQKGVKELFSITHHGNIPVHRSHKNLGFAVNRERVDRWANGMFVGPFSIKPADFVLFSKRIKRK